jgi:hypothetical protein
VVKNPDYWKPGVPHVDAIEYTLLRNRSRGGSTVVARTRDLQKQRPDAVCEMPPGSVSTNLIINREKPPFAPNSSLQNVPFCGELARRARENARFSRSSEVLAERRGATICSPNPSV